MLGWNRNSADAGVLLAHVLHARNKPFAALGTFNLVGVNAEKLIGLYRISVLRAESVERCPDFFEVDLLLARHWRRELYARVQDFFCPLPVRACAQKRKRKAISDDPTQDLAPYQPTSA
jgi:hypothetical protein